MRAKLLLGLIAVLWIGMILAVGMESVIKFDTPTLSRVVAFDEGRVVFHFFNNIQFILLTAMLVLVFHDEMGWSDKLVFIGIAGILIAQVFWFYPILSRHVDMLLAGYTPPATWDHTIYGWIDIAKLGLLSIFVFRLLFQFGK